MTKLPQSNIYSASADDIRALFGDYVEDDGPCIVLALSERSLEDAARNAIERSLQSFGYGVDACTYAMLLPRNPSAEGGDIKLDAQALFLLVEGLDPVCVICTDAPSIASLEAAYRTSFEADATARVMGRPAVMFASLASLLETEKGKQTAWHLLKSLPKRSA